MSSASTWRRIRLTRPDRACPGRQRVAPCHLGMFDGERKQRSRAYRDDLGPFQALASLVAISAFLAVFTLIVRVL